MKSTRRLVVSVLLLLGLDCAVAANTAVTGAIEESKIRNGFTDEYRKYLVQVHIGTSLSWLVNDKSLCAGSVISDFHVLTVAHCLYDEDTKTMVATKYVNIVRRRTATPYKYLIPAAALFKHPKFGKRLLPGFTRVGLFDVGIIKTNERLGGIKLKLPAVDKGPIAGRQLMAGAWGLTEPNGKLATTIKYGYFTVLSEAECKKRMRGATPPPELFCVSSGQTTPALCQGDSGAGLFNRDIHTVYGVYSSSACGEKIDLATITNLANKEVHDWVAPFAV